MFSKLFRNGLKWDDGRIPYNQLSAVLNEAVAGFAHLYGYGDSKCILISQLLVRPVYNLEDFNFPSLRYFGHNFSLPNHVTEIPLSVARLGTRVHFRSC